MKKKIDENDEEERRETTELDNSLNRNTYTK